MQEQKTKKEEKNKKARWQIFLRRAFSGEKGDFQEGRKICQKNVFFQLEINTQ